MRKLTITPALVLCIACDSQGGVFGSSYDECILKNARNTASIDISVQESCRRHFEEDSNVQLSSSSKMKTLGNISSFEFRVTNQRRDIIATRIRAEVSFYGTSDEAKSGNTNNSQWIYTWEFDSKLEPGRDTLFNGLLDGEKAPSRIFTVKTTAIRAMPFTSKRKLSLPFMD